jgi:hypothetical protein
MHQIYENNVFLSSLENQKISRGWCKFSQPVKVGLNEMLLQSSPAFKT